MSSPTNANRITSYTDVGDVPFVLALTQTMFRDAVRQERSWELAFESKRLFDLKRWGSYASGTPRPISQANN